MAILIDPPVWPAHATTWSHLVSDVSLGELHTFAVATQLPSRAFERDHYDVPAARYDDLIARGAEPVGGRELLRRLRASGLRRTPTSREQERAALLAQWEVITGSASGDEPTSGARNRHLDAVGHDLIRRWSQRGRLYHDLRHLAEVTSAVDLLAGAGNASPDDRRRALLAAWFHDAEHAAGRRREDPEPAGGDEEASARLAEEALRGYLPDEVTDDVARLVRMTAHHRVGPGEVAAALLSDADLAVLAAAPGRYRDYAAAIRAEYAHVPEAAFGTSRAAILEALLDGPIYATAWASTHWEDAAQVNLTAEIAALRTE